MTKNWQIFRDGDGSKLAEIPAGETPDFEWIGEHVQKLANRLKVSLGFSLEEGASAYRHPKKRGRPVKADAMTNAERQAKHRQKAAARGICPCCGQTLPERPKRV